jgi:hypothetical protein
MARMPENTLPAFQYAIGLGVTALELDLGVTKDERVVVNHDFEVNTDQCIPRIPALVGVKKPLVHKLNLKEVQSYDCGSIQKKDFPLQLLVPGARIPSFREFLYFLKNNQLPHAQKVKINIETKESEKHDALYIDLEINGRIVRVYNLHISWPVSPSIRKLQFTNFLNIIKTHPYSKIICGDLNVFGGLKLYTLLAFFPFGYSKRDIFFNERKWFNTQFQELEMQNLWKILSHGLCFPLMRNLTMCWFQIPSLLPAQHSLNRGMVLTTLLI